MRLASIRRALCSFLHVIALATLGLPGSAGATQCGSGIYPFPFNDVTGVADGFCPGIMEAYVLGVTKGTTATTFSPNDNVPRLQMTTFLQRSFDQGLRRGSRRHALGQWWTPQSIAAMQAVPVGVRAAACAADGEAIWVTDSNGSQVTRVQASTGKVLGTWTGATFAAHVIVAAGKVFVAGFATQLFVIDPTQAPGAVTVGANLVSGSNGLAFDGARLWTVNNNNSVSIINVQGSPPYPVTTPATAFGNPSGILFDGANIWVADGGNEQLYKLDASGAIIQSVAVGAGARSPLFDGANIWVQNRSINSVSVVQASTGAVTAVLSGDLTNQLFGPDGAAFDGERVLVSNLSAPGVTLLKAADLSFIAAISTGASTLTDVPGRPCSDGINFWLPLHGNILRF